MQPFSITFFSLCFNYEDIITQHLDSLYNINLEKFDFILVDNNSSDKSVEAIEKWREKNTDLCNRINFKLIKNPVNLGVIDGVHAGIKPIQSDIIKTLSGDDLYRKIDYVSLLDKFYKQEDKLILTTDCERVNYDLSHINYVKQNNGKGLENIYSKLLSIQFGILVWSPTFFFKKKLIDQFGFLYDKTYLQEDYEFFLRITKRNLMMYEPVCSVQYRQNPKSFGQDPSNTLRFVLDCINVLHAQKGLTKFEQKARNNGILVSFINLYYQYKENAQITKKEFSKIVVEKRGAFKLYTIPLLIFVWLGFSYSLVTKIIQKILMNKIWDKGEPIRI